ncbi:hypothetical protein HaLaN_24659, partial [Haematococcus lacustris]
MFNQHFGQDVRGSTDSVDELVQRNIQEVLQAAQQAEAGEDDCAPRAMQQPQGGRSGPWLSKQAGQAASLSSRPSSGLSSSRLSVGGARSASEHVTTVNTSPCVRHPESMFCSCCQGPLGPGPVVCWPTGQLFCW